jgi:putative endonuclease
MEGFCIDDGGNPWNGVDMDFRKIRGQSGESIALAYLEERGFRLIERNWNCRLGEIDLIVERDGETRFIEVKLRRTMEYGYPEASITRTKLRHLSRAIECWMKAQAIRLFAIKPTLSLYLRLWGWSPPLLGSRVFSKSG